jgi:acyl carrier protein
MSSFEELQKAIAKITHCDRQSIGLDTELKDIDADSLHWVQIIVALENAFDIEIDAEQMRDMTTIRDFVGYLDSVIGP